MLNLKNITLVCICGTDVEDAQRALLYSMRGIEFGAVKLLSCAEPKALDPRIQLFPIPAFRSGTMTGYSEFFIRRIADYIDTEFALFVHPDGFVLHPENWKDEFLRYDYIGAPWNPAVLDASRQDKRVGNGGFSLRSRKILKHAQQHAALWLDLPEDVFYSSVLPREIRENGAVVDLIRFAPLDVAILFSIEDPIPEHIQWHARHSFGFHGKRQHPDLMMRAHAVGAPSSEVSRIAVFRLGGMGDGLISTAIIAGLHKKFPHASIDAFSSAMAYDTMRHSPFLAHIENNEQIVNAHEYDLIFEPCSFPRVYGRAAWMFDRPDIPGLQDMHENYNPLEILKFYQQTSVRGICGMFEHLYRVPVSIEDAALEPLRKGESFEMLHPYATINTGYMGMSRAKAWPAEKWNAVARWLHAEGYRVYRVGHPEEEPELEDCISLQRQPSRKQVQAVAHADLHLGSDGYFCHVAAARRVPRVVLWGVTPPEIWGHAGQTDVISPTYEMPWNSHPYWWANPRCQEIMAAIEVEDVIEAAEEILRSAQNDKKREEALV